MSRVTHALLPGQMTIEECIAESFVEPCPDCAWGRCNMCAGRTVDHALDETVPCPCRAAGHKIGAAA